MQIRQTEARVHRAALPLASCRIAGKAMHFAFASGKQDLKGLPLPVTAP